MKQFFTDPLTVSVATVIGTLIALLAFVISKEFRHGLAGLARNRAFRLAVFALIFLMIGILVSPSIKQLKDKIFPPDSDTSGVWPPPDGILANILGDQSKGIPPRKLRCGINGSLPGFSEGTGDNSVGLDADFCRVIATAIFGDYLDRIEYIQLDTSGAKERFEAVRDGRVDVAFRNTTWNVGRDLGRGVDFGPVYYFDTQAFLARKSLGIKDITDLDGQRICVLPGSTSKENLDRVLNQQGIRYIPVTQQRSGDPMGNAADLIEEYNTGPSCDIATTDLSQILGSLSILNNPDDHEILRGAIQELIRSKEPFSPVFVEGDPVWRDIVTYAVYTTIYAAELGIDSSIASNPSQITNPLWRDFLGISTPGPNLKHIGDVLGINPEFSRLIISRIGNYRELYDKNLLALIPARGYNQPYIDGGLLTSPPFTLVEIIQTPTPPPSQ